MKLLAWTAVSLLCIGALASGQSTFAVTGTPIPTNLLMQHYGKLPKGVTGYDLNICNSTNAKQSIVSSEIYQALAQENLDLHPIGRQIMLAAILRNQNHSAGSVISMILNSATGVLSVLSSSKYGPPAGVVAGAALGSISAQQILNNFKPILTSDQLEKFESEVLEPALVLDSGSCVERTIFATANPPAKASSLKFHIR